MPPLIEQQTIHVKGLRDLQRAFQLADRTLRLELRDGLRDAAEPVRQDAETLAVSSIARVGPDWSRMRTGVTSRLVYVAPRQRGVKGRGRDRYRRRKFADILAGRAMEPALERNVGEVARRLDRVLDRVGKEWERA